MTLPRTDESLVTMSEARAPARSVVGDEVRELLRSHLSLRWRERALSDRVTLGEDGLGLDSIRLLDVVLACEERFQVTLAVDELNHDPRTLGDLVALIEEAINRTACE